MTFSYRRFLSAALVLAAMAGGPAPAAQAASPDFYGIKMNSENHARDLAPDELALFPVRRGFDKNVYAYGNLDVNFNKSRSITFQIFNNTDNDLLVEKSFREYYVVLRNGERYRLDEPGMARSVDRVDARSQGTLRADFGELNVTKEQIEMVVCSFDMGKVKIVLLPIALDPPPPLHEETAKKLTKMPAKEESRVYAKDQLEPRLRGENEIKRDEPKGRGRFPVMDLPIFSWLKSASKRPDTEIRPVPTKDRIEAAKNEKAPDAETLKPMPKSNISSKSAPQAAIAPIAPAAKPAAAALSDAKPAQRRGLFGSIFSIFDPSAKRAPAPFDTEGKLRPAKPEGAEKSKPAPASKAAAASKSGSDEFFWKPRDLEPIQPIGDGKKKAPKKQKEESKKSTPKKLEPLTEDDKPFYMRRMLDESVKIPHDEPITAVSTPNAKNKAPVLKPVQKLQQIGPRTDAKIVQINSKMGFIIVNAGAPDGIRENMVFNVYRRGKVIAKAVVRKVTDDASAAMLMKEWAREDVAVGDPVSFF